MTDAAGSDHPVEPEAEDVEQKYGDCAELYALTRAEVAAKMGRESAAREWVEVGDRIDDDLPPT